MNNLTWLAGFVSLAVISLNANALSVGSTTLRTNAFFEKQNTGLFQPLDLKKKTIRFSPKDQAECGQQLQRKFSTLEYSCTLNISKNSKHTKLRSQKSPQIMNITFGNTEKQVRILVSKDGRHVTFRTKFDKTGVDLDVASFNKDFHKVYSKVAQLVIAEAMMIKPLQIEVLESK